MRELSTSGADPRAAYTRPYHPVDFARRASAVVRLDDMIDQLRREKVYRSAHRSALTLVRDETLTALLTVAQRGAECDEHLSKESTVFVVLDGDLTIESDDGGRMTLASGSAGALARDVRHKLTATSDCAYLLLMGRQADPELPRGRELGKRRSRGRATVGIVALLLLVAGAMLRPEARG